MIGSCNAEPPDPAPRRLRIRYNRVAIQGSPCQDASRSTIGRRSVATAALAKVRCGRYGRCSIGRRLRRAAARTESASLHNPSRSPFTRVHSTWCPNRPPPPNDKDSGGCRPAVRLSLRASSSTMCSPTSPRKASVTCHCSGRVHRRSGASSRSATVLARSSSTTSPGGVSATNSRTRPSSSGCYRLGNVFVGYVFGLADLRVARRNRQVNVGHNVVLRPCASRYQLVQPPAVHTVPSIRRWTTSLYATCACGRTSTAATPVRM